MIKHIVMWKIDDQNTRAVKEKLESMTDKTPQILKLETGVNIESKYTNRNLVLIKYHETTDDLYNYQIHPYHIEVKNFVGKYTSERVCLDFEI